LASREGSPKPLQPEGGLHLPPCPLYVRGEVQGRERGPIHKISAHRRHNGLESVSPGPSESCAEWGAPGQPTASTASPTTSACARQQQAIHDQGNFRVFSATKTPRISLGHGWPAAPAAIFGHAPPVVPE
jgi:hypothetical protein